MKTEWEDLGRLAKKPLRMPELRLGARREFIEKLQRLVWEHGDLSVATIAKRAKRSHQAVHKALTREKMPTADITRRIIDAVVGEEKGESVAVSMVALWKRAVEEEREERWAPSMGADEILENRTAPRRQKLLDHLAALRRRDTRWKLGHFARRAGIGPSTAYAIMNGTNFPRWDTLWKLVKEMGGDQNEFRRLWLAAYEERRHARQNR